MLSVLSKIVRTVRTLILALFASCVFVAVCSGDADAQDSTIFVDDFELLPVGTLSRGCGAMTAGGWYWESFYYFACYSAGWGVDYAASMTGSSGATNKALELWGGVPFGGGGDCAVTASDPQFQSLTDYTIAVTVSPEKLRNGIDGCKSGMVGIAGRVQDNSAFCSGYLLALVLNNSETLCGQGSLLNLYRNERGPYCNGSEAVSLLASQPVDITADLGGNFSPDQEYVLKLCLSGSDIYGGVWNAQDWAGGDGPPMAELTAADDMYTSGTFGIYQGASLMALDNVIVSAGGSCLVQGPSELAADLNFDPNTLNTKSKGKYVTCYVELPEGLDPWDIDIATMTLNGIVPAQLKPTNVGDHDMDGIDDRMMKFSRSELIALLSGAQNSLYGQSVGRSADNGGSSGGAEWSTGGGSGGAEWNSSGTSGGAEFSLAGSNDADTVEVWVSGLLADGTAFAARDTIRVIGLDNGSGGNAGSGTGGAGKEANGSDSAPGLTANPSVVKGKSRIGFELKVEGHVSLIIYDAAGRMINTLVNENAGPGVYDVTWDRTANNGGKVPPGVYFIKLKQSGMSNVQKLMVVR
jgi:hypothetical protein